MWEYLICTQKEAKDQRFHMYIYNFFICVITFYLNECPFYFWANHLNHKIKTMAYIIEPVRILQKI